MKVFRVKNVGDILDDLLVHVDENSYEDEANCLVPISRIQKSYDLFESYSMPVNFETVYIKRENLEPYDNDELELQTDNPYGGFLNSGVISGGKYKINYGLYEKAFTIKVTEEALDKVIYSHSFIGKDKANKLWNLMTAGITTPNYDWNEMLFTFKEYE